MTQKLYLQDAYLKECEAIVTKADGKFVVLDRTIFYAQSGGQPTDTGKITSQNGKEYKVVFAKNMGEDVSHEVDSEGLKAGESVKCSLDWQRRYTHMKMHTSAHLLAACIMKETGALITGNQLDEKQSRMDFDVADFDKELLKSFEQKVNEAVEQNMKIGISFMKSEDALANPTLFRLKSVLPKDIPILRIVAIGEFDIQADGGTHVASTKEIGKFKIVDFKNKGAQNRRVYWELE